MRIPIPSKPLDEFEVIMGIENAILIGLSRQVALRNQMDLVANNIANVNTTGYKSQELLFREFLVKTDEGDSMSYVESYGSIRDTSDGPMKPTENPLDLAISGQGYFTVGTDDGPQYTRNGHFRLNEDGQLVTQDGDPVLDVDGKEIEFADPGNPVQIARDGTVTAGPGEQFRIAVVNFDNQQALEGVEGGLFKTDQPANPVEAPSVIQGMLEGSNVQAIVQMTRMIDVQRAYESMQKMISTESEIQTDAIERLGAIA
ncbi:flagellar basal-body rod protein FlgF [Minwuia sp.]|uniref:flagellar basal-body rod protein FlgF n=1 Tax=Minwuia sp. TaxID=2493630 RepID=UPI003A95247A